MRKRQRTRTAARRHRNWTEAHVRRLFWRAGFGATPAQARQWSRRGKKATLDYLFLTSPAQLRGPAPTDYGAPLDPVNEFGHDKLWWLDHMVRSTRPLQEKMTLFWHDHFATRSQTTPLMLAQNATMRAKGLGSFSELLYLMTLDTALARFLSLTRNVAEAPNENYARELMELFTLGSGYTETDIREAARALTGVREQRENGQLTGLYFDSSKHDDGIKTIFGQTGKWGLEDVLRLCLAHPAHAPFLVTRLWDFFVGGPVPEAVRDQLAASYTASGYQIAPLVRAILARPELYVDLGQDDMVKWPAVLIAGQLRTMGAGVSVSDWVPLMASMGQILFSPPSVAGWDWGARWLSSNAMRARFSVANVILAEDGPGWVQPGEINQRTTPDEHLRIAVQAVGAPQVHPATRRVLKRLIASYGRPPWKRSDSMYIQLSLRHLLIAGPDNQLC
jgi:uncharacterized protein (DUF1800 family)